MVGEGILPIAIGERFWLRHADAVPIDAIAHSLHEVGNTPGFIRLDSQANPGYTGVLAFLHWLGVNRVAQVIWKVAGTQQRHSG